MSKSIINNTLDANELDCIRVGDFNEDAANRFQDDLFKHIEKTPRKPVIIRINSYGGEVDSLVSMLDTMDAVRSMGGEDFKIVTHCTGKAMSAGALLLGYGDVRFADPNSRIMIHQIIGGCWGSYPDMALQYAELDRVNQKLLTILKKSLKKMNRDMNIEQLLSRDLYLSPEEAKNVGFIDHIGAPIIKEQILYGLYLFNNPEALNQEMTKEGVIKNEPTRKTNKRTTTKTKKS